MGFLQRLLYGAEARDFASGSSGPVSSALLAPYAMQSVSGRKVTDEEALRTSAVYACVRILSESVSILPAHVVRKDGARREPVDDHPVSRLIGEEPNPEMDAGEFWRFLLVYALFGGNAYAWVERNEAGIPVALWPLPAGHVRPGRDNARQIFYEVTLSENEAGPGQLRYFRVGAENMMHVRAFGLDRLYGVPPLQAARESIGTARSAQDYASRFYERDASPGGVLQVPDELTDEQYERLEEGWRRTHEGLKRAHAVAILENGAQWHPMGISPQDAEFINTRKFETSEIARIFGVPPHLVGDVERSTSWGQGIEQQNIGFVQYSLLPWMTRLERVATRILLRHGAVADDGLFVRWDPTALLRGDQKARYDAYAVGKQWGWLSTNDIRALEDISPIAGGDAYLEPENMRSTQPQPEDVREKRRRAEVVKELWQAGFDADEAAAWVGVPVTHGQGEPTTVQQSFDDLRSERRASDQIRAERLEDAASSLRRFFAGQRGSVLEAVAGGGAGSALGDLWDGSRFDDELTALLRALGSQTARAFGGELVEGYDPDESIGRWLARNARITAENTNRATRERIDGRLVDGVDAVDAVNEVYDFTEEGRADELARSQTTMVGQRAQQDAAERSAEVSQKRWVTAAGESRDSHAAMNGETVRLGERFSNGAMYPGDPDLPQGERINCLCDMEFI